jgi:hypothetical protein
MATLDGTLPYDDSDEQAIYVSRRAATLLTKVLVSGEFAQVREVLNLALTDHGRAVRDRLIADLACQVLDVREPGHTCSGCDSSEPICYCNAKGNVPHSTGSNGCAYA